MAEVACAIHTYLQVVSRLCEFSLFHTTSYREEWNTLSGKRERERESAGGMESSTGRLIKTVRCTRNGGKLSNSLFDGLTWLCLAAALQLSFSPFPVRKGNTVV